MAFGSRRWFDYSDDDGTIFAILADESNVELLNTGADGQTLGASDALPDFIHKRTVKLKAGDQSTKTVPILTRALYDAIALGSIFTSSSTGEEVPGTPYTVIQKIPERRLRAPIPIDTGKIDGDQP